MVKIKFNYADAWSDWHWRTQTCTVESVEECKEIYGLDGNDVNYEIISVVEIEDGKKN